MKIFDDLALWQDFRRARDNWQAGLVPTMGGLHAGHGALVERSVAENPVTVVSLFLNATQFDQDADLQSYPARLEDDLARLESWGVQYVLTPAHADIYPDNYRYRLGEHEFSSRLCGASRPGHFDGVLTVVLKLLNLVQPRRAYFGEKDWQQLKLVRGMTRALFLDTEIVACPVVRGKDGLALSSRNARLTPAERARAPELYRSLCEAPTAASAAQRLTDLGFEVEYVEDVPEDDLIREDLKQDGARRQDAGHGADTSGKTHRTKVGGQHKAKPACRRLAAVRLGRTRLIDNVPLPLPQPQHEPEPEPEPESEQAPCHEREAVH